MVPAAALRLQAARHLAESRFRLVGRHILALPVHGREPRRRICSDDPADFFPTLPISVPAFAMVGMGTMVGSGTGAALTAVAMVFEMTRDYDIVLPMILAVAVALGVRRLLSRENIYTMKLVRRGHPIPRALHANMFLVRSARRRHGSATSQCSSTKPPALKEFLRLSAGASGMRHVVVTRGKPYRRRVAGEYEPAADGQRGGMRRTDGQTGTAQLHNCAFGSVVFDVIARLSRRGAVMGVVVSGPGRPRADKVVGVITKEHIADEVASSVRMYRDEYFATGRNQT